MRLSSCVELLCSVSPRSSPASLESCARSILGSAFVSTPDGVFAPPFRFHVFAASLHAWTSLLVGRGSRASNVETAARFDVLHCGAPLVGLGDFCFHVAGQTVVGWSRVLSTTARWMPRS